MWFTIACLHAECLLTLQGRCAPNAYHPVPDTRSAVELLHEMSYSAQYKSVWVREEKGLKCTESDASPLEVVLITRLVKF